MCALLFLSSSNFQNNHVLSNRTGVRKIRAFSPRRRVRTGCAFVAPVTAQAPRNVAANSPAKHSKIQVLRPPLIFDMLQRQATTVNDGDWSWCIQVSVGCPYYLGEWVVSVASFRFVEGHFGDLPTTSQLGFCGMSSPSF